MDNKELVEKCLKEILGGGKDYYHDTERALTKAIPIIRADERAKAAKDIGGAISLLFVRSYSACMKRLVEIREALKEGE